MMNYLTIDNVTSKSIGLYISAGASYNSPNRKLNFVTVVGKNGDIILDDGQFENIQITYPCFMIGVNEQTMQDRTRAVSSWLQQYTSYVKITDSYKPDYYRMGVPTGSIEWDIKAKIRVAETTLQFNCKPQLFYTDGDTAQTFTANGTIVNPSVFPSKPEIRVYGSGAGVLTIGSYTLTFSDIPTYLDINTEIRYAYKNTTNYNYLVTASDTTNYMQIDSGSQAVQISGSITSVEVAGKWWTT